MGVCVVGIRLLVYFKIVVKKKETNCGEVMDGFYFWKLLKNMAHSSWAC